jgi:hypothetical protein
MQLGCLHRPSLPGLRPAAGRCAPSPREPARGAARLRASHSSRASPQSRTRPVGSPGVDRRLGASIVVDQESNVSRLAGLPGAGRLGVAGQAG